MILILHQNHFLPQALQSFKNANRKDAYSKKVHIKACFQEMVKHA